MAPPRLKLRTGHPVWLSPRTARRAARHPRLTGVERADVAIVGGGITGAIAALRFAEAGVDAIVLEADRVGQGSTAASSALLLQEPDARLTAHLATRGVHPVGRYGGWTYCSIEDNIVEARALVASFV